MLNVSMVDHLDGNLASCGLTCLIIVRLVNGLRRQHCIVSEGQLLLDAGLLGADVCDDHLAEVRLDDLKFVESILLRLDTRADPPDQVNYIA